MSWCGILSLQWKAQHVFDVIFNHKPINLTQNQYLSHASIFFGSHEWPQPSALSSAKFTQIFWKIAFLALFMFVYWFMVPSFAHSSGRLDDFITHHHNTYSFLMDHFSLHVFYTETLWTDRVRYLRQKEWAATEVMERICIVWLGNLLQVFLYVFLI